MYVDEIFLDKMFVDERDVGKMSLDKMTCCLNICQYSKFFLNLLNFLGIL